MVWCGEGERAYRTQQELGEVGGLDVVVVHYGGDGSHESQGRGHVEVQVMRLSKPERPVMI